MGPRRESNPLRAVLKTAAPPSGVEGSGEPAGNRTRSRGFADRAASPEGRLVVGMVRTAGVEPAPAGWKPAALPLGHVRDAGGEPGTRTQTDRFYRAAST